MDIGEKSVSPEEIVDEKHDEETCVFCQAGDPPEEIVNALTDEHDEDLEAEAGDTMPTYKFKNDAGTLGNALGGRPGNRTVNLQGNVLDVMVAAHHLIPGNASLKNSQLFISNEYLWKDGKAKGNIGYNVNAAANGVWSPGNYAVRSLGPEGETWGDKEEEFKKTYAFAAMEAWGTQFHDSHGVYSDFVTDCLDKVYEKLNAQADIWCPEAKKKEQKPDEKEPLYALVRRLETISARMKRMQEFPTTNWKRNIYTSRFVKQYMDEKPHIDKATDQQ